MSTQAMRLAKSVLPEDGDGASPRNVVFKRVDAAVRPRRLYCMRLVASYTGLPVWGSLASKE
jgi:hypothetical protein